MAQVRHLSRLVQESILQSSRHTREYFHNRFHIHNYFHMFPNCNEVYIQGGKLLCMIFNTVNKYKYLIMEASMEATYIKQSTFTYGGVTESNLND